MSSTPTFTSLMGQVRTLENAAGSCGTDEYKESVSENAVNNRADLARQARTKVDASIQAVFNERDALLAEVGRLREALKTLRHHLQKQPDIVRLIDTALSGKGEGEGNGE